MDAEKLIERLRSGRYLTREEQGVLADAVELLTTERDELKELNGDPMPVIHALGGNIRKLEADRDRLAATLFEACDVIEQMADQQAMSDPWYLPEVGRFRTLAAVAERDAQPNVPGRD